MARDSESRGRTASSMFSGSELDILGVLVVDDNSFTMKMVGQMLEALGLRVDLANGGRDAQGLLTRNRYAMVLTDFQMPEVDGYTLAVWIKKQWQDTRVFIMTGCSPAEVADYVDSNDVDCWIYKPFNLAQLRDALAGTALR
jgi:CheY-like chemotaxis protein